MIKVSRSGVEKFLTCKRCFVLEQKYKVRAPSLPFTLNIAVDNLCKNEFDYYRERQEPHPIFLEHKIDAVPFKHPKMNEWRSNFKGIHYIDELKGYDFYGAVDDVWVKPNKELIISDVKTTAKTKFDWEKTYSEYDYPKGYRRQLEMYQWIFRQNGFKVSNDGYLIYYNGLRNEPMFNQQIKFELHLIKLDCDDSWVEEAILSACKLLASDEYPPASKNCDTCQYLKKRWDIKQVIN